MYHTKFSGTHYEMGFSWGRSMRDSGNLILRNIPYKLTEERFNFARGCVPIYEEYFPEILREIQGLADGQDCDAEALRALLLSMYAIPPACGCSCFALANEGNVLLGRNSDFLTALEEANMNVSYHFTGNSYDFTGNTTSFIQIEDGVNERGLAVGLTSVFPGVVKPGLNAGMLLRFFLERCGNTEEVISYAREVPIASAQTITVADRNGSVAVIECNSERVEVIRPTERQPFVCAVNSFQSEAMAEFKNPEVDDWFSARRLDTMRRNLTKNAVRLDVRGAQELLSGKRGFICQYDRRTGRDTVWSVVYDLKNGGIYLAEGNPARQEFKRDDSFTF